MPATTSAPPAMSDDHSPLTSPLPRREFIRLASVGTGAVLSGGLPALAAAGALSEIDVRQPTAGRAGASSHVIVVGAGAWGAFTALNLRKAGNRVTIIDQFGPANSRSTSGDETRGIRSSYGDRTLTPELWTAWARKSIERWRDFDNEHAKRFGTRFFYTTGDVILREKAETFTTRTQELWTAQGVKFEVLTPDDALKRWPQIKSDGNSVVLYEPDAGVVRARGSVQAAVALARDAGAKLLLGRVTPGAIANGKMDGVTLGDGTKITADAYVFCCGPWMEKVFPEVMHNKTRVPIGHVCYFGQPMGDERFTYPNIPSWNVPGVTGWAALPVDSRGFRVRGAIAPPAPPRAAGADDAAPPPPPPAASPDLRQQDPDLSTRWSNEERIEGSRRVLAKYFPALADAPLLETRSCHYEISVNRNFIVDHVPGADNAWIAGMGQAEGFKFSIVLGEYIASRVTGRTTDPVTDDAFRLPTQPYEPAPAGTSPREDEE